MKLRNKTAEKRVKKRQPTERLFDAGDFINECVHTPIYIYICSSNAFIDLLNCPSVLLSARTLAYVLSRHMRRAFILVTSYLF